MHKGDGREGQSALYLLDTDMSQYKLMRGIILSALGLALSAGFFIPFQMTHAAVLYEQSNIGTEYDVLQGATANYGYYVRIPQPPDELISTTSTITSYTGTAEWLRIKRLAGLSCDAPFSITITTPDRNTIIGIIPISSGVTNGDYCDFPITGPNRTDMAIGALFICLSGDCDNLAASFVLDGSPQNSGYVTDGTETVKQPGGWAFQICDSGGCEGGFEVATTTGTSTATSTDTGTGTTTATSTATSTPPTGASSVLFLPGIMGSRLYEKDYDARCSDITVEVERWFSSKDCHQIRLITDTQGNTVNDIYTKDSPDAVIDTATILGLNLYKTFFDQLATWKTEGKIHDYALVPYDWRLRLDDLLKAKVDPDTGEIRPNPSGTIEEGYLYQTLENLAASSSNGKVTIVAHSNGGLLAKTFLATLQKTNDPLLGKVDNLILVASPQVGTPDTITGMLHGTEIGPGGRIVSEQTSRTLLNTMPFAFHLLPNESYFDGTGVTVDSPVITFEQGTVTTPWINRFGQTITNATSMEAFMTIDGGRIRPETADLANPEVVPKYLFDNYTKAIDELMNTWVPPTTMQVKEVAGVGVETLSGLEYFTDTTCVRYEMYYCLEFVPKLGMRPVKTFDGDETVVAPSALAMSETLSNVERLWVNLFDQNDFELINRVHKDIFEVSDISSLIANTLFATTSYSYTYLSNTPPTLSSEKRLTFTLHSPLDLVVINNRGEKVSSSSEEIDGSTYQRYGEVQYISIPDSGNPATAVLNGEATGSFTLEVATFSNGILDKRHSYSAIPSSTSTKATIIVDTDLPLATTPLQVDYDGNGTNDVSYDTKGVIVPKITYTNLFDSINKLQTKALYKKLLTENAKIAQQYHTKSLTSVKYRKLELLALGVLREQVLFYERNKIIKPAESKDLVNIINSLSK
jgi:pimeloyl-ACP methyl ester carboxylesterase